MKNFLAIDTAGEHMTVIACKGGQPSVVYEPHCGMNHSVALMNAVDAALSRAGMTAADCDAVCAVVGPGSFTGIRIGIAAAKGFCAAADKPALGITTFETLAYNAESDALAVVPAGRGGYYVCGFSRGKVVLPPQVADGERLAELAKSFELVSAAALPLQHRIADPSAGLLARALAARAEECGPLQALYIRRSQAEEERARRGEG